MKDLVTAYQKFWSQFHYNEVKSPFLTHKLPAFQEGFVKVLNGDRFEMPDFPYLVYQVPKPGFTESALIQISIWDRPPDGMTAVIFQDRLISVVSQIEREIQADGAMVILENGAIQLKRGNPWINILDGEPSDPKITRAILNVIVENYTL